MGLARQFLRGTTQGLKRRSLDTEDLVDATLETCNKYWDETFARRCVSGRGGKESRIKSSELSSGSPIGEGAGSDNGNGNGCRWEDISSRRPLLVEPPAFFFRDM
jgi:hypothetical protein